MYHTPQEWGQSFIFERHNVYDVYHAMGQMDIIVAIPVVMLHVHSTPPTPGVCLEFNQNMLKKT